MTQKKNIATILLIGVLMGLIIGCSIGSFYMVKYLDLMKKEAVYPRDDIIEHLNRINNLHYEYEKGDEYITSIYVKGIWSKNGTMILPPICSGPMCPYNFTGVVMK